MINIIFLFIIIIVVFVIGFLVIRSYRKEQLRQEDLLTLQAQQQNGRIKTRILGYPQFVFNYRGLEVTLFSVLGQQKGPPYTYATVSFMLPEDVRLSLVKRENMIFFSGRRGWQTGNPAFDEIFLIKGYHETFLRNFLTSTIQEQLLTFPMRLNCCRVEIRQDHLRFKRFDIPKTVEEYDRFIRVVLACIDQLYVLYGTDDDGQHQRLGTALHPEKHAPILSCLLAGLLFNPCISGIYNWVIAQKLLPHYDYDVFPFTAIVLEFPLFTALFSFVLFFIGVYGVWRWKMSGWSITVMLSYLYLGFYSTLLLSLYQFGLLSSDGLLILVPIYIMLFSVTVIIYLWRQRKYYR